MIIAALFFSYISFILLVSISLFHDLFIMNTIEKYYFDQAGGGQYYIGDQHQKGYGIGSLFAGLLRSAIPIFKPLLKRGLKAGAKAVGQHVIKKAAERLSRPPPAKKVKRRQRKRVVSRKRKQGVI